MNSLELENRIFHSHAKNIEKNLLHFSYILVFVPVIFVTSVHCVCLCSI